MARIHHDIHHLLNRRTVRLECAARDIHDGHRLGDRLEIHPKRLFHVLRLAPCGSEGINTTSRPLSR